MTLTTTLGILLSLPLPTIGITVLFAVLFGLAICFSSYRLFRAYMLTMGFLSGFIFVLMWNRAQMDLTNPPLVMLAVIAGIIVGLVACMLFRLGVALPGALLGIFAAYLLSQSFSIHMLLCFVLVVVCSGAGSIRQLSNLPGDPYLPRPEFKTPS
jgi:hypothetical protein